ncbi:hypothetical protein OAG85_03125 [Verrucomicrobiales bacterium]|nr:hypothetical protein [Verrucomicrobiales bacterium]
MPCFLQPSLHPAGGVIIFVLAFGGMPNEVHFRLRKNHSTGVKFVMGGLFLLLFPFLIGTRLVWRPLFPVVTLSLVLTDFPWDL